MQDRILFTHKVRARLTGLCLSVVAISAVCIALAVVGINAYQKAQHVDHMVAETFTSSMEVYHASQEVNGVDMTMTAGQSVAGYMLGYGGNAPSEKHAELMANLRELRRHSEELKAIFEEPETSWASRFDGNLRYLFDLMAFTQLPQDVRSHWHMEETGQTLGDLLTAQHKTCLVICMSPDLTVEERVAAITELRTITVDLLLPKLSAIHDLTADWQSTRMDTAKLVFVTVFIVILLLVGTVRSVLVLPLARQLERAAADLDAQNRDLEDRVERRTRDLSVALHGAQLAASAKQNFLTNMSHELRTPMNGVLGIAALLEASDLREKQRHLVHTIMQSGSSLMRILDDVLETASIASGKLSIEQRPSFIKEVIEDTVALHLPSAAEKGLALSFNCRGESDVPVMIDPERFQQVLGNLVQNAIKFTDQGSIELTLTAVRKDSAIESSLTVRDTGCGIREEDLDRIFEPFERVDHHKIVGGTGIGLALCKTLIVEMGGSIAVQSTPDRGSCFKIVLSPRIAEKPELEKAA